VAVLAVLAVCSLLIWLVLTFGHGMFWRTDVRLEAVGRSRPPAAWPDVTVIVPARDEAAMLPLTLPTLLTQRYPGTLRVVLVDDASTDGTAATARRLAGELTGPTAAGFTALAGGERPAGWAGKVWALEQGVRHTAGTGEWLLFTDADIAHAPGSVERLVRHATARRLDLVSVMAVLRTGNGWERLVIPAFVYFFAQLYPFRRINRPAGRTAGAAGGCVLVRRESLARAGGLPAIRSAIIDDCSLARVVKDSGGRIWLGLADPGPQPPAEAGPAGGASDAGGDPSGDPDAAGDSDAGPRSVRPYPVLADLWRMVARSAYTQLRHSPVLLGGAVVALALTYLVPPAVTLAAAATLAAGGGATTALIAVAAGLAAWTLMIVTYVPMVRYYRQPVVLALTLPAVAALYLLMTLDSARAHRLGRGAAWKGRAQAARP
jgi:hypothetical protein